MKGNLGEMKWPKVWTDSQVIHLQKKATSSCARINAPPDIISHRSKVMLRIILNRLKRQADQLLVEEQA
ncbi:hypothetical protein DPMN_048378 [Dreissena polymorpha]|uniref:Uncharacterized protein n=1 Tax=Dreissena polymorpha TaxID=45954 RepID=A0A9D4DCB0_DREPO|nr:hypothetical protein DPMN_048376 [Dreissena polymorpha]KAH3741653.1 hypothetical protein DPMN_048378 [Dreissena polymorpha]